MNAPPEKEEAPAAGEAVGAKVVTLEDQTPRTVSRLRDLRSFNQRLAAINLRLNKPTGATVHEAANGSLILLVGGITRTFSDIDSLSTFVEGIFSKKGHE